MNKQWTNGAIKREFNPQQLIICHESAGLVKSYEVDIQHRLKTNPLLNFMYANGLLKTADFDTLEQEVQNAAVAGRKDITVCRLDRLTMISRLQPTELSRRVSRYGATIHEERIGSVLEIKFQPEQQVLQALDPSKPKLQPSELLTAYITALAKWAVSEDAQNARKFKQAYRPLHNLVEKNRSRPLVLESVAQEMLALVTGQQVGMTGFYQGSSGSNGPRR